MLFKQSFSRFPGTRPGRVLVVVAAGLLCVAAGIGAGRASVWGQLLQPKVAAHAPTAAGRVSAAAQGVKINGWWTVAVLDRGWLVAERQFENSLVTGGSGDALLANLLAKSNVAGPWTVVGQDSNGVAQFSISNDIGINSGLSVSTNSSHHLILAGQTTPASSISIGIVATSFIECPISTPTTSCNQGNPGDFGAFFTRATLPSPIAVAAGQVVQVTVDISFS